MNKYIYCPGGIAQEFIPEFNPDFPGVPIDQRYAPSFLAECVCVPEEMIVENGWIWDSEAKIFNAPPDPAPIPEEPVDPPA